MTSAFMETVGQVINARRLMPNFESNGVYECEGRHIQFKQYLPERGLHFVDLRTQLIVRQDPLDARSLPIDVDWVLNKMCNGAFHRVAGRPTRRGYVNCAAEIDAQAARNLDKSANLRFRLLNAADALGPRPSRHQLQQVIYSTAEQYPEAVAEYGRLPTLTTLRSWRCRYGAPGRRDMASCLRKGLKQPRKSRLHPQVVKIVIEEVLRFWAEKLKTVTGTYDAIRARVFELNCSLTDETRSLSEHTFKRPNKETVRNWINSFACWDTYYMKYGRSKANAFFKASGNGVKTSTILELCMIDHTVIDCIIVDETTGVVLGRPVLTLIICAHSRVVFGWHIGFEMASFAAVSECLKSAARPKRGCAFADKHSILQDFYGKPHEIIVDNGLEFVGSSFLDAAADMAIHIRICPVKSPTYKAIVERVFRTLNENGIHTFEGTTLNKQKMLLEDTDYRSQPVYTLATLRDLFGQLLGVYHLQAHSGLGGQSPIHVWTQEGKKHGLRAFDDIRTLDTHVNLVVDRKLRRTGIAFECLRYSNADVSLLLDDLFTASRKKAASIDVKVKFNPLNLAEIHVFNPAKAAYVTLPCVNPHYASDLSLYQHKKIKDFAAKQSLKFISEADMLAARRQLNDAILEASPKLRTQTNRALKRLAQSERVQEVINLRVGPSSLRSFRMRRCPMIALTAANGRHRSLGTKAVLPRSGRQSLPPPPSPHRRHRNFSRPRRRTSKRTRISKAIIMTDFTFSDPDDLSFSRATNDRVARAIATLENVFVPTPDHTRLYSQLDALRLLGQQRGDKPHRYLRCLAPAASGKTTVARNYARNVNARVETASTAIPVIYYSLQNNLTSKSFIRWAIDAFGYQAPLTGTEAQIRRRLLKLLELHKVELIILDEIHHLTSRRYSSDILNLLKSLVNDGVCPIALLGTPAAESLLNGSSEFTQRCAFVADIKPLGNEIRDRQILAGFLMELNRSLIESGICAGDGDFLTDQVADLLSEVTKGVLGLISRLLQCALEVSIRSGANVIRVQDMRRAIDLWAIPQGVVKSNPFAQTGGRA